MLEIILDMVCSLVFFICGVLQLAHNPNNYIAVVCLFISGLIWAIKMTFDIDYHSRKKS